MILNARVFNALDVPFTVILAVAAVVVRPEQEQEARGEVIERSGNRRKLGFDARIII